MTKAATKAAPTLNFTNNPSDKKLLRGRLMLLGPILDRVRSLKPGDSDLLFAPQLRDVGRRGPEKVASNRWGAIFSLTEVRGLRPCSIRAPLKIGLERTFENREHSIVFH